MSGVQIIFLSCSSAK